VRPTERGKVGDPIGVSCGRSVDGRLGRSEKGNPEARIFDWENGAGQRGTGGSVGLPGVLSVGGGLEGGRLRSDGDVKVAVRRRQRAKGDWVRPGRVQRVKSRGEGGCGSGQRRREGERARVGQVGGKVLGGGAGDDGNGRCGRPVFEFVDLDEFGSAGSRKRQGEGPGGKGMGQGRRGGQGEKVGVEADALVDENDVDGRQEKNVEGAAGYVLCYEQRLPAQEEKLLPWVPMGG